METKLKTIQAIENIALARATMTSDQSVATGTTVKLSLTTETYDPGGNFDSSTNYDFTAPVDGYYQINGGIGVDNLGNQKSIQIFIFKNTGVILYRRAINGTGGTSDLEVGTSDTVYLEANDTIDLRLNHNHGSDLVVKNNSDRTFLSIALLST